MMYQVFLHLHVLEITYCQIETKTNQEWERVRKKANELINKGNSLIYYFTFSCTAHVRPQNVSTMFYLHQITFSI